MKGGSKRQEMDVEVQESLLQVADKLVGFVGELLRTAKTEEDLRIGFEKILDPVLKSIGVEPKPRYERLGAEAKTIYRGRPDAVHGQVIIEYEPPGAFSSNRAVVHAHEQLVGYMTAEAQVYKTEPPGLLNRLVGVGFDGRTIFFVQYPRKKNGKTTTIDKALFTRHGPYPFDPESARTFLTYLRALARCHLLRNISPTSLDQKAKSHQWLYQPLQTHWKIGVGQECASFSMSGNACSGSSMGSNLAPNKQKKHRHFLVFMA